MRPEMAAKDAVRRGRLRGAKSLNICEAAQEAINETRDLLDDVACQLAKQEEKPQ